MGSNIGGVLAGAGATAFCGMLAWLASRRNSDVVKIKQLDERTEYIMGVWQKEIDRLNGVVKEQRERLEQLETYKDVLEAALRSHGLEVPKA